MCRYLIDRRLDRRQGRIDLTGHHPCVAKVHHLHRSKNISITHLRQHGSYQPRLLPNRGRALPCADPRWMCATVKRNAQDDALSGSYAVGCGHPHEGPGRNEEIGGKHLHHGLSGVRFLGRLWMNGRAWTQRPARPIARESC